eukprot:TRINITY_DN67641_c0_g1_i1.p1 TRINITY_DN67641_c0_g1~~TRINITY_DN67641_c0_g1_i1.p1  ORF type:complete len:279 (-),score=34.77 TRINITY_DN67641_c0_g1_i1:209-1045(-)
MTVYGEPLLRSPHSSANYDSISPADTDPDDTNVNLCCPSVFSCLLSILSFPSWLQSVKVIDPNEAAVVLDWGKYVGTLRSGWHVVNPASKLRKTVVSTQSTELRDVRVIDREGTPLVVSGIVAWRVTSPRAHLLNIEDPQGFLRSVCVGALKSATSSFPFEHPTDTSICAHPQAVTRMITDRAQALVAPAGVRIISVSLANTAYDPTIASAMLVRQQAMATLQARKVIVQGAVGIVNDAVQGLTERGHSLSPEDHGGMVSNLLTVLCSDHGASPVISL